VPRNKLVYAAPAPRMDIALTAAPGSVVWRRGETGEARAAASRITCDSDAVFCRGSVWLRRVRSVAAVSGARPKLPRAHASRHHAQGVSAVARSLALGASVGFRRQEPRRSAATRSVCVSRQPPRLSRRDGAHGGHRGPDDCRQADLVPTPLVAAAARRGSTLRGGGRAPGYRTRHRGGERQAPRRLSSADFPGGHALPGRGPPQIWPIRLRDRVPVECAGGRARHGLQARVAWQESRHTRAAGPNSSAARDGAAGRLASRLRLLKSQVT